MGPEPATCSVEQTMEHRPALGVARSELEAASRVSQVPQDPGSGPVRSRQMEEVACGVAPGCRLPIRNRTSRVGIHQHLEPRRAQPAKEIEVLEAEEPSWVGEDA